MNILYLNCQAGISGDMLVGALLDLGIDKNEFIKELEKLKIEGYKVKIGKIKKRGIKANRFIVKSSQQKIEKRNLKDIYEIIDKSLLEREVKMLSKKIFLKLAKAEAKVHKTPLNKIHFHEVGAIDSIIDIVSTAILINKLKPERIYASGISLGHGRIKSSHGITSLPVPAVKELLKDVPVTVLNINKELTTPTGAAIIRTIVNDFEDEFDIKIKKRGYGAGKRNLNIPNVLEVIWGEAEMNKEKLVILETNIDDMNPEFYSYVIEKLIKEGAKDAFIQPIIMKKNRIGTLLTVICEEKIKDRIVEKIFNETTTFAIRINKISRIRLEREIKRVKTEYGVINVKIGKYKGEIKTISPEYEDCKKIAENKNIPIKEIYDRAKIGIYVNPSP